MHGPPPPFFCFPYKSKGPPRPLSLLPYKSKDPPPPFLCFPYKSKDPPPRPLSLFSIQKPRSPPPPRPAPPGSYSPRCKILFSTCKFLFMFIVECTHSPSIDLVVFSFRPRMVSQTTDPDVRMV